MYRNVAIQKKNLVKLWLLKLPKQHFNLALLIFNIANIIKHIFTFLGYILEKYGHFLKNLLIKISDFRWLENPQKTHTHTHTHILFSHFEKEFSQLAKCNQKKQDPATYGFCLSTGIPSRLVDHFEGVDQLYETGGCHVGAMSFVPVNFVT
jgi:hypothetical protein